MAKRSSSKKRKIIVRNIDELAKGVPKADELLVHFTKAQWSAIAKRLKRGGKLPKWGVFFAYTPLPDGSGGIGGGDCIAGPCEICAIRPRGFPGGSFGFECRCRRDPECPQKIPPPAGHCRLVFRRQGVRVNWQLTCESVDCRFGRCRLTTVRRGTQWIIGCACQ